MEKQTFGDDHPIILGAKQKRLDKAEDSVELTDEQLEAALPKPCGYRLLIALPKVEDKFEGTNILKTSEIQQREQITSVIALVLDMGPDAYADTKRFPNGPWCKVGDYILIGPYKGLRFLLGNSEYRIITDDLVEGVVADPRGYRRV
jgi:co-chaperonin GroES (HSP10)